MIKHDGQNKTSKNRIYLIRSFFHIVRFKEARYRRVNDGTIKRPAVLATSYLNQSRQVSFWHVQSRQPKYHGLVRTRLIKIKKNIINQNRMNRIGYFACSTPLPNQCIDLFFFESGPSNRQDSFECPVRIWPILWAEYHYKVPRKCFPVQCPSRFRRRWPKIEDGAFFWIPNRTINLAKLEKKLKLYYKVYKKNTK